MSGSHFFLSVIPNVHPIQMCIFFGGVVAEVVGIISITVIVVGIIVVIRNVATRLLNTMYVNSPHT